MNRYMHVQVNIDTVNNQNKAWKLKSVKCVEY